MTNSTATAPTGLSSLPAPIAINVAQQAPLKLTSSNYMAWSFQFRTLLTGFDLMRYVDGTHPCPSPTVSVDKTSQPNPDHIHWVRQDQLILSAFISSLTPTLIPFIASASTSKAAWDILSNTYGRVSRGHIVALKNQIHNPKKGTKNITNYMLGVKSVVDELSLLGVVTDPEDLSLKVLNGLDDSYKELSHAIQARDTTISFEELHEKLLTAESQMRAPTASSQPVTAFVAGSSRGSSVSSGSWRAAPPTRHSHSRPGQPHPPTSSGPPPPPGFRRPYKGTCQLCGTLGHSARYCNDPQFAALAQAAASRPPPSRPAYSFASAHTASAPLPSSDWVLDSGASHHITTDLANMNLHYPYEGTDGVVIDNGEGSYNREHSPTRPPR